jgi:hypothetical protein
MPDFLKSLYRSTPAGLVLLLACLACSPRPSADPDPALFRSPPDHHKVHAWWHWMDNAISREGITKDLEAMKAQGINGVTVLNVSLHGERDFGIPPVVFGTEAWYEMFAWAVEEAARLGMEVGAHNCDGWSTSGGPWIDPSMSMKNYVWSTALLEGGAALDTLLPRPADVMGFYRDVAVVAWRSGARLNSFQQARPRITVNDTIDGALMTDGSPLSRILLEGRTDRIDLHFDEPFACTQLSLHPRVVNTWESLRDFRSSYQLLASDNGVQYRPVTTLDATGVNRNHTATFPEVRARHYRLLLTGQSYLPYSLAFGLSELELLKSGESPLYNPGIDHHMVKTVSVIADDLSQFFAGNAAPATPIPAGEVVDLSGQMSPEGRLQWDVPEGQWTVLRFGYTTTGVSNMPSTTAGRGLEVDKMDTAALNLHFRSFPAKLVEAAGPHAGNTFRFVLIDSWECGFQNWTARFPDEFQKRRGYSIMEWLPALCGSVVGDEQQTEAFLDDFRSTIAELIEENYYRHFADLTHEAGLELHAEVIYGGLMYPPLDILRSNRYIGLPMFEFWTGTDEDGFTRYSPVERTNFNTPAQGAALYGRPVVPAEAYTGYARYSEFPWELKCLGDQAFCSGINRMVLHSYVHQPFDRVPGLTLGKFGNHFNRHNTWWNHAGEWMQYQARVQYLLQQGAPVADILYYAGDRLPQHNRMRDQDAVPIGYQYQECNLDALQQAAVDKSGRIRLPNGQSYALLLLPLDSVYEHAALEKIGELAGEGAIVVGNRPVSTPLKVHPATGDSGGNELISAIWGTPDDGGAGWRRHGKGSVIWGMSLGEVLNDRSIAADFNWHPRSSGRLLYFHRRAGDTDIYFVANQEDREVRAEGLFRVSSKTPELWDPQTGAVTSPALYAEEGELTRLPLRLAPRASVLVVFRNQRPGGHLTGLSVDSGTLFPAEGAAGEVPVLPEIRRTDEGYEIRGAVSGKYRLTESDGTALVAEVQSEVIHAIRPQSVQLAFSGAETLNLDSLVSWTSLEPEALRYYSGTAAYSIGFELPGDWTAAADDELYLCLGEFAATAEVALNGSPLGTAWMPGQRIPLRDVRTEGTNLLEVEVANVYRNRILGDLREFGEVRSVWTTSPVTDLLKAEHPLQSSGLLGPLQIVRVRPVRVSGGR